MLAHAVLVNGDFIVAQHAEEVICGDIKTGCSAITMVFVASRQEEVEGGTLYVEGCPNTAEAAMMIAAKVARVVISASPYNADEMTALELLQKKDIEVVTNTRIIL